MTIAYPLQNQKDYTELLYSLRSIEKHITPPYEIVIIGDTLPDWITNVTWIDLGDIPGKKQLSIRRKILAALEYSNSVFMMNDDIYLLKPMNKVPYYYNATLKSYAESGSKSLMKQLELIGKPINNFDIHYPIIYDQQFKKVSELFSEEVILKSMYCNYMMVDCEEMPDCKIQTNNKPEQIQNIINTRPCFSTGVYSLKFCLPILSKMFNKKSKFEL